MSDPRLQRIRTFIEEDLGWYGDDLTEDYPLLENRVIDSLGLFRIVYFLEQEYGVHLRDDQVVPANFRSLGTIAEMLDRMGSA